jgi:2-phospho-L-lactate transferase/gluconeogenesis factor (CofD/UPF0052 family)
MDTVVLWPMDLVPISSIDGTGDTVWYLGSYRFRHDGQILWGGPREAEVALIKATSQLLALLFSEGYLAGRSLAFNSADVLPIG